MSCPRRVKKCEFFAGILIFLLFALAVRTQSLSGSDVETIIAHAVSTAVALNQRVTVSVTDNEGNLLGTFVMAGAAPGTVIRSVGRPGVAFENAAVMAPDASWSKAGTAAIFSTSGNAFSTRTASFIIQEHFAPGVDNRPGGPLYGVQFSTLLCSDIAIGKGLPLGLSGDPGGLPLYRNGRAVGGVGIEGDGLYSVDRNPSDNDQPFEEVIAVAASRGFEAPTLIRGDNILVEGVRFPFANVTTVPIAPTIPFASLPGAVLSSAPIVAAPPSDFVSTSAGGVPGQASIRFPTIGGVSLSVAETQQILADAAQIANITRAAIRQPIGSNARVSIAVVDLNGNVAGIFRQLDAPVFGLDVSVQKARTSLFFARADAGAKLQAAGFGSYVARAQADGISLDGSIAFSNRAVGFLHRPLFPDGINASVAGPFSSVLADWSPFNVGLQLDLVLSAVTSQPAVCRTASRQKRGMLPPCPCTSIPELPNGIQIFAGGLPIYRNGALIGAVGVSGDGIDQDDFIAAAGANRFAPPENLRSDRVFVRGVRLPFLKFPARPTLP